jgi:hypothetical protein
MANDYCIAEDIKDNMPDVTWGSTYDLILDQLITKASRLIDGLLKREPGAFYVSADTTRYFDGSGCDQQWIGELAAAPTTVYVAETGTTTYTTWAATDYICWPYNALLEGLPYQRLDIDEMNGTQSVWYRYRKSVKVVGKFGFAATTPPEIAQAATIQTVRWFKRGQQAFQDAGAIVELGQLRYTQQLDPDVKTILSDPRFQRMTI